MPVIGLIIILTAMMVGIGSNLPIFLDIPSLLIVVLFTVGALIMSRAGIVNMFGAVFSGEASKVQLEMAAAAWKLARTYIMAAGWLTVLVGGAIMAKNMDDYSMLGPGLAIMVLAVFWAGLLGYGIFLPLQKRLEDRAQAAS